MRGISVEGMKIKKMVSCPASDEMLTEGTCFFFKPRKSLVVTNPRVSTNLFKSDPTNFAGSVSEGLFYYHLLLGCPWKLVTS